MKKWAQSLEGKKIIGLAATLVLGAAIDGLTNKWTWRQFVVAGFGVAIVVVRAWFTTVVPSEGKKAGD